MSSDSSKAGASVTGAGSSIPFFPEPTIAAVCDGIPVHAFGYTHVLGASPDLVDLKTLQVANAAELRKVPVKKSGKISFNLVGGSTTRIARTVENDYLPLETVHLIDGDPDTCWSSRPVVHPDAEPFTLLQPQAAYYVMRNLATAPEGYRPAKFDHTIEGGADKIECYAMAREDGRVLALWRPGRADDEGAAIPVDIRIPDPVRQVSAYDCLNGVEQELLTHADRNETVVRGICVRDYPILVRLDVE